MTAEMCGRGALQAYVPTGTVHTYQALDTRSLDIRR